MMHCGAMIKIAGCHMAWMQRRGRTGIGVCSDMTSNPIEADYVMLHGQSLIAGPGLNGVCGFEGNLTRSYNRPGLNGKNGNRSLKLN